MSHSHIAILDFGSQYTHLITKRIREFNVLAKIYPHDVSAHQLRDADGIILSGGPQSVYEKNSPQIKKEIFNLGKPILGICYGHHLLAHLFGGCVQSGKHGEYGRAKLKILEKVKIFKKISQNSIVWMSHGDTVVEAPDGFDILASTPDCAIAAMGDATRQIYSLQFHSEVDHSEEGAKILKNFLFEICQMKADWQIKDELALLITKIKKQVGKRNVFVLVSGGVDSNVTFSLLTRALGKKRVLGLYVDTGFMRLCETEEIMRNYRKIGLDNLEMIDASQVFFQKLKNIYDPERKRQIIGRTFLDIKNQVIDNLGLASRDWLLGQGTIYPDIIESGGTKQADKIKTHHNRVSEIEKLIRRGLVVEPLADFYKFEVRALGKQLGLPSALINRHPFPGPGLAIRCLCYEVYDKNKIASPKSLRVQISKLIQKLKLKKEIQYEVLDIKSVGVQGDNRTYAHPLVIWGERNWSRLDQISSYLTNASREINRVVLLLNPQKNKQKQKFLYSQNNLSLTSERIRILQIIDNIVMRELKRTRIYSDIWQVAIVLIPVLDSDGRESIVLRPVNTRDVMTLNFYAMSQIILRKVTKEILATNLISYVFYDITNKPPGTTEWE